jgi:hypothetical protein
MSFNVISGYPTWENYIPSLKTQALIMMIMAQLAYEENYKLIAAVLDDVNNNILTLGTTIYFTADGQYSILQPNSNAERIRLSYEDGSLVSRYYQYPIPGVDPNIPNFDFATQYKPGLPPVDYCGTPLYVKNLPCKDEWSPPPGLGSIAFCVPNPGQPFANNSILAPNPGVSVYGYFKPPPPPCPDNPFVIAFHCIQNYRQSSNNPLDTLQYIQFQTLAIRYKGVRICSPNIGPPCFPNFGDGIDLMDDEGYLIDRDGKRIVVMTYLNEVDYFPDFLGQPNPTYGYNLTYNSFVFSFRGSTYVPDFLEEIIPPEILIPDLKLSNPPQLLREFRPWLVNKASAMYKAIATTTNDDYFLTPFPEEQSIPIQRNYSVYLGATTFTGHSYGASLANILALYLVPRFPGYVNIQTYGFAPMPWEVKGLPPINPDRYLGYLYIRAFSNENDCVPFFKVPNFLPTPQDYVQILNPPELFNFYHIRTDKDGTVNLERIKSIQGSDIPVYLSLNKDHDYNTYVEKITKINDQQFQDTVLSQDGINDFTITPEVALETFVASIPTFPSFLLRQGKIVGANPITQPLNFLYLFGGFNNLCVDYKNLIKSLRLC